MSKHYLEDPLKQKGKKTKSPLSDAPEKKGLAEDVVEKALIRGQAPIKENFRWVMGDWKTMPAGKNSVKIKGVAIPANVVSKNQRKYLDEELKMAARTLGGKPITVNHESREVGNVTHAEYEDGKIEYIGIVNKEPYVRMVREHDPKLRGVSVQAAYIHNRCVKCGAMFITEKAFQVHMQDEHGVQNGVKEVHGMMFDALSLVVSPEIPGVEGATIQVMETTTNKTILRLFETALSERGYSLKKQGSITVSTAGVGKLGEEAPTPPCPEGWHEVEGACVKDVTEQEVPDCPEGQVYNPETKACEPITEVAAKLDEIFKKATKTQMAKIYKTILAFADKNVNRAKEIVDGLQGSLGEKIDLLTETIQHMQKVYFSNRTSRINEAAAIASRVERAEVRLDNLEAKQKGRFKGHSKPIEEPKGRTYLEDPLKKKKD